jgi:pyruvate ferredoxin oxidoreductase gamma subunit
MFRIRFHGRGGQGIKTAGRVLGQAFFLSGFEVQDAPRYGAERRGAPMFAYVRADMAPIHERGLIQEPDLVVVVDDTLVGVPAAGVLSGLDAGAVLLISTSESADIWRHRLNATGQVLVRRPAADPEDRKYEAMACCGVAAKLCGVIDRETIASAIETELAGYPDREVARNLDAALAAFDAMARHQGIVKSKDVLVPAPSVAPAWVDLPLDPADAAAPVIHAPLTSVLVRTGLWRTMRPVIDRDRCRKCWWVCSTFCPDGAIAVNTEHEPVIDYDHCKGCMICVAQCPPHAIEAIPERDADRQGEGG